MSLFTSLNSYKGTAFEVIIIVFGVMLSFLLNEIRLDLDDKDEAISTLQQIKNDLEKDLYDTNYNLPLEEFNYKAIKSLIEHFEDEKPYDKSMDRTFGSLIEWTHFLPSTTGLQIINSKGVDYIENDSLRIKFLELHNYMYEERLMHFSVFRDGLLLMKNFFAKNFTQTFNQYIEAKATPNNYNELMVNAYFNNLLFFIYNGHSNLFYTDNQIKIKILEIIPLVDEEIIKLQ
tara:strand:+ start:1597 stop:2292 length:696 start_codon:yes stop_codon:yes gene_type:complete